MIIIPITGMSDSIITISASPGLSGAYGFLVSRTRPKPSMPLWSRMRDE